MGVKRTQKKKGGTRKHGRSKRKGADQALSLYVKGKISFEQYNKTKKH